MGRRRRSLRRWSARWWLRQVLRVIVALVIVILLAVGLVALVVLTPGGTRLALRQAVQWYDGSIPGSVAFSDTAGPLGDLCLYDVRVADAEDRPLVTVHELCLDVRLGALVGGVVDVRALTIAEPHVHLWPTSTWGDLARPGPEPPPSELPGPDLPVRIEGSIAVWGLDVIRHEDDGEAVDHGQSLVHDAGLHVGLAAEGRWGRVELATLWGQVPSASLYVIGGRAELEWTSPTLTVHAFELASSAGIVQSLSGHADVEAQTYAAQLRALAFVPPAGDSTITAAVELLARGSAEEAAVSAKVRTSAYGRAELHAVASFEPVLRASAIVHVEPAPALARAPIDAWVTAVMEDGQDPRALVFATTPGAQLVASWDGAQARARAFLPGAQAQVDASLEDGVLRTVEATVTVRSAAEATAAIDGLLPAEVPRLEGAGQVDAECRNGDTLQCRVQASVRREGDWLETTVGLDLGDRIGIDLERLQGRLRGQPVQLTEPARVSVGEGEALLTPLRLAAAGGTIAAAGRVVWEGAGRSDLGVELRELDLGVISQFVPSVRIRGRLSGVLALAGDRQHPQLDASLELRRLGWAEEELGRVAIEARYDDRDAQAEVRWSLGSMRARVFADVPVELALEGEAPRWRTTAPMEASVDLERIDLAYVSRWIEGPALTGTVHATVRAGGPLGAPIVAATLHGTRLAVDGEPVGNVELAATLGDDALHASVTAVGRGIGHVTVDTTIPVTVDPMRGFIQYHPRRPHHVVARLRELDLGRLEPLLRRGEAAVEVTAEVTADGTVEATVEGTAEGTEAASTELGLGGRVRAELEATAEAGELRAHLVLVGHDLRARGLDLGAAEIDVAVEPKEVLAKVVLSGPWMRAVELGARIPLELHTPDQAPRWRADEPLLARLVLSHVDLRAPSQLGLTQPLSGALEGTIDLHGTMRHPELTADLEVDDLRSNGHPLGHARLRASYDGEAGHVKLEQAYGAERIEATARVPLRVSLATPMVVDWRRHEEHRLSLQAQGVDEHTVGAVVELPRDLRLRAAARVEGRGTIDDPWVVARLRGSVAAEGTALAGMVATPVAALLDVGPDRQHARVVLGTQGPQGLVVDAQATAPLARLVAGEVELQAVPFEVDARARDFPLRSLSPLLPSALHDPRGTLQLALSMEGTPKSPTLAGSLALDEGEITVVPLNQKFTAMNLRARLDGPDVVLESFSTRSGNGTASALGRLHVEPQQTRGMVRLVTRKLPIVRPGMPMMQLDTRLQVQLDATGAATEIDVQIHDTLLDVLELSPLQAAARIPSDDGVIYIDAAGTEAQEQVQNGPTPWLPPNMELAVTLADPLRVRGPSADMDWTGHIEVLRPAEAPPNVTGSFVIDRGRVGLLGNDFDIESAQIRFPEVGDLDPVIDLVAVTDTAEAQVTMLVRGRMSRPTLTLRSDPSMPESDIFALLITGHADATQADDTEFSAQAASVLAAFSNPELQRHLRDRIGIDRVGVGFGETVEQPIVTVGKRVSDKVYVEAGYHHNAPLGENSAEARLEYRFAPPRWSVETWFGDAAQGGVGLWWRKRFATRGQRRAEREAERAKAQEQEQGEDAEKRPPTAPARRTKASPP